MTIITLISSEKRDMLIGIAKMYYIEGLSQEQIAKEVHVSRPTVSRMLKQSVFEGIVQIRIDDVSSYGLELGKKLRQKFGVRQVIVTPLSDNLEESKNNVGAAAARYLESSTQNCSLLGIAWGTTIGQVVKNVQHSPQRKMDIIQLLGGVGNRTKDTDANMMALTLSKAFNGDSYLLQAPFMVQSKVLRDLLLDEPHIRTHFEKIHEAGAVVIGLGSTDPELSAQFRSGHITYEDAKKLRAEGAVGDICGRYLDINGNQCHTALNDRMIAVTLQDIKNIPTVIAVASGEKKTDIITAALRGKYIDVLITDESAAVSVLEM
ncbi:MAG: sugar-binding transcriptional regulator [Clostridia bacterium]|nr:sugar-binding transcriptional regulator [Clostridia bacterium]